MQRPRPRCPGYYTLAAGRFRRDPYGTAGWTRETRITIPRPDSPPGTPGGPSADARLRTGAARSRFRRQIRMVWPGRAVVHTRPGSRSAATAR